MEYGKNKWLPKTSHEGVYMVNRSTFRKMDEADCLAFGWLNPVVKVSEIAEFSIHVTILHIGDDYIFCSSEEEGGEVTGEKKLGLK